MITKDQFKIMVAKAARAPSVHNTQAFRFKLCGDNAIEIWGASDRILHVGDPHLKDHMISAGAALEGVRLALSEIGLSVKPNLEMLIPDKTKPLHLIVRASLDSSSQVDPLSKFVNVRKAFRGTFEPVSTDVLQQIEASLAKLGNCQITADKKLIEFTSKLYDIANGSFLRHQSYAKELIHWLRLSSSHPNFNRDGLNADCLALRGPERLGARLIFLPGIFSWIMRLPFGPQLVGEAGKINSSTFVLTLLHDQGESLLDVGARFYRAWLTLARFGISACPLSALVDHEPSAREFGREVLSLRNQSAKRLVNVFRCGVAPQAEVATSPRLPVEELILAD